MLCHRGPVRSLAVDTSGRYMATCGADSQVKTWDVRMYKEIHSYYSAVPAVHVDISQRGMLGVGYGGRVQIWDQALNGPKAQAPYLNHQFRRGEIVRDFTFCPYDDAVGVGHSGGFSNLIVPGAGEPNYDSLIANPFETRNQRREQEVAQLLRSQGFNAALPLGPGRGFCGAAAAAEAGDGDPSSAVILECFTSIGDLQHYANRSIASAARAPARPPHRRRSRTC